MITAGIVAVGSYLIRNMSNVPIEDKKESDE
jgi:hypothetical protein